MNQKPKQEFIDLPFPHPFPYKWATGHTLGKALKEIRDKKKILATKCPECGRVSVPAKSICGRCHGVWMGDNWLKVSDKGTLQTFIRLENPRLEPLEGKVHRETVVQGDIELDGAGGTAIQHYLKEQDLEKLRVGMRMQAVWKEKRNRVGDLSDILYFEAIEG